MRFELDDNGYVITVLWGCYTGLCLEYTGAIPDGYSSLVEWADNACINAYYLDDNGNLVLDEARKSELEALYELQEIDNTPVRHKDIYESLEALNNLSIQHTEKTVTGNPIQIEDGENTAAAILLTGLKPYSYSKIDIFAQTKQMLKDDAVDETVSGVTFTKQSDGGIKITGTATADLEYNLSGSSTNTDLICGLKKGLSYYLNIGGYQCEMRYYNGTTTEQVYVGDSGVIVLSESKNITQILLKIPSGTICDTTIYPMLEYGETPSPYETYNVIKMSVDFSEYIGMSVLYPSETLYPGDTLYPLGTAIDYILISDNLKIISVGGVEYTIGIGKMKMLKGYNFFYTTQETDVELTYTVSAITGTFKGTVMDPDNVEISGRTGLLSTFQYIGENIEMSCGRGFQKIGYTWYQAEYLKSDIAINVDIPEDFVITEAKVTLRFMPYLVDSVWSCCRNLKLYKGSEDCVWSTNGYSLDFTDSGGLTEIVGALGADGWTTALATSSNHAVQTKVSEDIKDSLSVGNQVIYLRSSYSIPSVESGTEAVNAALYSGMAVAVLNVVGYKKYKEV